MKTELSAAVEYLTKYFNSNHKIHPNKMLEFEKILTNNLEKRFQGHWYEEKPLKGSAFRAMLFGPDVVGGMDSILLDTLEESNIKLKKDYNSKPFVLYVNPGRVAVKEFAHREYMNQIKVIYAR